MKLRRRRAEPETVPFAVHVPADDWHTVMLVPYEGALIEFFVRGVPYPELPWRGRFAGATAAGGPRWWIYLSGMRSYLGPSAVEASRIVRWRYL